MLIEAYSIDLRQKNIDAHNQEQVPQRKLAKRFNVAPSFIVKLLKQYRETAEIAPKLFTGGVKLKLKPSELIVLSELIESNNDATLAELCFLLKEKTGVSLSRATMGRMTQRLNLTEKKHYTLQKKRVKRFKN